MENQIDPEDLKWLEETEHFQTSPNRWISKYWHLKFSDGMWSGTLMIRLDEEGRHAKYRYSKARTAREAVEKLMEKE